MCPLRERRAIVRRRNRNNEMKTDIPQDGRTMAGMESGILPEQSIIMCTFTKASFRVTSISTLKLANKQNVRP